MGRIVYESPKLELKEMEISVSVNKKDSPYRRKNANIMIEQEDLNFAHLTPNELKKIGKYLIEQSKYIKENFDENGNRKEAVNV